MAKKDFKRNPAMSFINQESIDTAGGALELDITVRGANITPPEGYKLNPIYIETKSRRVQLLMQPSLHEAIIKKAKVKGISTNEAINEAIANYIEKQRF